MKKYLLLSLLTISFFSCGRNPGKNEFKLEGYLENGQNRVLLINEISPSGNIFIDSVRIDKNGEFEFFYKMPYKSFYTIETDKHEFITLLPDYKEIIRLDGDYDSVSLLYQVEGSLGSKLLWRLNNKELEGIELLNEINREWELNKDSVDNTLLKKRLDSLYYDAWLDQKVYYYDFIYDNRGSLAVVMALYKTFNQKPLFPISLDAEVYQEVLDGLKESMPENPHTKHFEKSYFRKSAYEGNVE